jgi:hypothetical protein
LARQSTCISFGVASAPTATSAISKA